MESVDAVKIVLEGTDEFGSAHRSELTINKDLERLSADEIGFSGDLCADCSGRRVKFLIPWSR